MGHKKIMEMNNGIIKDTKVVIRATDILPSGKPMFRYIEGKNKTIVSGSEINANKLFNFGTGKCFMENNKIPTYPNDSENEYSHYSSKILNYDTAMAANGKALTFPSTLTRFQQQGYSFEESRKIYLFCCGIDGCGIEDSRKFAVMKDRWIAPYGPLRTGNVDETDPNITTCLIPFRYQPITGGQNDLSAAERDVYFGRSVITATDGTYAAYFFKTFDAPPELVERYEDGTSFADLSENSIWLADKNTDPEVCVKLRMSVSNTDIKEWFSNTTGQGTCRVNCISLCTAIPYLETGTEGPLYFKDIRPITRYNFNNESLQESTKALDITYYLYF